MTIDKLMKSVAKKWKKHRNATAIAIFQLCFASSTGSSSFSGSMDSRGKKSMKSARLCRKISASCLSEKAWLGESYKMLKQTHCAPTCAIPNKPAAHSKPLTTLQQATSARDAGSTKMVANVHVPDVVPSRIK